MEKSSKFWYMDDLQERITTLEQNNRPMIMEGGFVEQPLPDVEARVDGKSILLKIQCERRKGSLLKIIKELEKLNITTVVSTNVASFGNSALDITIVVEMEKNSKIPVSDVVTTLRAALEG